MLVSVAGSTQLPRAPAKAQVASLLVVFFDRHPTAATPVNAVLIDDQLGGLLATRHLIEQGYHIAYLGGPAHLHIYRQRRLGCEQALREAGLPVLPELALTGTLREADGEAAARHWLALPKPPDAIFAAGDFAALGCLRELLTQGRRVPAEIGVIGFSNEFFSTVTAPALSTVEQHCEQLGQAALQLLLQLR